MRASSRATYFNDPFNFRLFGECLATQVIFSACFSWVIQYYAVVLIHIPMWSILPWILLKIYCNDARHYILLDALNMNIIYIWIMESPLKLHYSLFFKQIYSVLIQLQAGNELIYWRKLEGNKNRINLFKK